MDRTAVFSIHSSNSDDDDDYESHCSLEFNTQTPTMEICFSDKQLQLQHQQQQQIKNDNLNLLDAVSLIDSEETEEQDMMMTGMHHHHRDLDSFLMESDRFKYSAHLQKAHEKLIFLQQQNMLHLSNQFKCPICLKNKQKFFCPNCIRNGDFTHSKMNVLERFADKKLKFIKLKGQQLQNSTVVKKHFANTVVRDNLNLKIRETEKNLNIMSKIIAEKKYYLKDMNSMLNTTKRNAFKCQQQQMRLNSRTDEMRNLVAKQSISLHNMLGKKSTFETRIQQLVRERVCSLTAQVFQLSEEYSSSWTDQRKLDNCSEASPLLNITAELPPSSPAKKQQMIRYKIIEPWIGTTENLCLLLGQPGSLNYSDGRESSHLSDEARLSSALSYLCHLTNIIAIFCDVHLPKRLLFSDFYLKNFKKGDVLSKIAKLNANVIFLCIYNHVDGNKLHPKNAFHNLQLLLSAPALGILGNHIEISHSVHKKIQDSLLSDLHLADKNEFAESFDASEDQDYHFVENNIPDLNFNMPEQSSVGLLSLVSSLFKQ